MLETAHPFFFYAYWLAWGLALALARRHYVRELLELEPAVFAFLRSKTGKWLEFLAFVGASGLGCGVFILLFGWETFIPDWNDFMLGGFLTYTFISLGSKFAHQEWALEDRVKAMNAGTDSRWQDRQRNASDGKPEQAS